MVLKGISSQAAGKLENKKNKFQGQEYNDDLGVDMYEFKYRMDDPQTGRFWQVDPLADKYVYNSTYAFSENKVTGHVELEGLEAEVSPWITGALASAATNPNSVSAKALGVVAGVGNFVINTVSAPVNLLLNPPDLSLTGSIKSGVQMGLGVHDRINTIQNGSTLEKTAAITETILDVAATIEGVRGAVNVMGLEGQAVYRVSGGDAEVNGYSWTPVNPASVENFRDAAGLPSGGESGKINTGQFITKGTVAKGDIIKQKPATPLDGNKGGLPEFIINPSNVNFKTTTPAKPKL
jgi:RHS repeat-associated protein